MANQFVVKPGQHAIVNFLFGNNLNGNEPEVDIDVLYTGSYVNTPDGRMAPRITYRNIDYANPPFDTGVNNTANDISYDVQACFKYVRGADVVWQDLPFVMNKDFNGLFYIEFGKNGVAGGEPAVGAGVSVSIQ